MAPYGYLTLAVCVAAMGTGWWLYKTGHVRLRPRLFAGVAMLASVVALAALTSPSSFTGFLARGLMVIVFPPAFGLGLGIALGTVFRNDDEGQLRQAWLFLYALLGVAALASAAAG